MARRPLNERETRSSSNSAVMFLLAPNRRRPIDMSPFGKNNISATIKAPSTAAWTVRKLRQTASSNAEKYGGANHRSEQGAEASDQNHHQRLDGEQDVEHVARIDIMYPAGIDAAGHSRKHSRESECGGLVQPRIHAKHDSGILILLDAAQRKADLAAVDGSG